MPLRDHFRSPVNDKHTWNELHGGWPMMIVQRSLLDLWFYPMTVGKPLPTLPIWLDADLRVLVPLEESYEETCRLLRIA